MSFMRRSRAFSLALRICKRSRDKTEPPALNNRDTDNNHHHHRHVTPRSLTMTPTPGSTAKPSPFPPHPAPRTWLLTSLTSPLSTAIARAVLSHGDNVVAGVRDGDRGEDFREWRGRFRGVGLDAR